MPVKFGQAKVKRDKTKARHAALESDSASRHPPGAQAGAPGRSAAARPGVCGGSQAAAAHPRLFRCGAVSSRRTPRRAAGEPEGEPARAALSGRKATGGEAAGKRPPDRCRSHRLSRPPAWRAPRPSHRAAHPRSRAGGTVKTVTALTFELIQTRRAARPLPGLRRAASRCPPILSPPSSLPTLHVRRRRVSSLCGPVCAGPVPTLVKGEPGHRRREAGPAGGRRTRRSTSPAGSARTKNSPARLRHPPARGERAPAPRPAHRRA